MQTIEQSLREFGVREDDHACIVRLARSLHRVGIARRKSTAHWQRQGIKDCNLARDMLTWLKWAHNRDAFADVSSPLRLTQRKAAV